ncbi:unnamed protein product [Larinioides sclopetarius]|uniref:Uncharacterized protein n=1 Tax=Larinioides sclopetarius TaxID=280406 RepID=A0AAV1YXL1_9ARAC
MTFANTCCVKAIILLFSDKSSRQSNETSGQTYFGLKIRVSE